MSLSLSSGGSLQGCLRRLLSTGEHATRERRASASVVFCEQRQGKLERSGGQWPQPVFEPRHAQCLALKPPQVLGESPLGMEAFGDAASSERLLLQKIFWRQHFPGNRSSALPHIDETGGSSSEAGLLGGVTVLAVPVEDLEASVRTDREFLESWNGDSAGLRVSTQESDSFGCFSQLASTSESGLKEKDKEAAACEGPSAAGLSVLLAVLQSELPTLETRKDTGLGSDYHVNVGYAIRCLRDELPTLFYKEMNFDIYRNDITFQDPLNTFQGIRSYRTIFWALRFHGSLFFKALWVDVNRVWQPDDRTIVIRWSVRGVPRVPWEARGRFDGTSTYKLDKDGKIYAHKVDNLALSDPPKYRALTVMELLQLSGAHTTPGITSCFRLLGLAAEGLSCRLVELLAQKTLSFRADRANLNKTSKVMSQKTSPVLPQPVQPSASRSRPAAFGRLEGSL